jgi:hypothetical protein
VDDPDKFTSLYFEAVKKAGVRALVSKAGEAWVTKEIRLKISTCLKTPT